MPTRSCPNCESGVVIRPVPNSLRGVLDQDPNNVGFCQECLLVHPADGTPVDHGWTPADTSDALPSDPAAAVGLGMLVTLLESLALNRTQIEAVVEYLEEQPGVDPLLALDRLETAPLLQPSIDVSARREQLAQVLSR